ARRPAPRDARGRVPPGRPSRRRRRDRTAPRAAARPAPATPASGPARTAPFPCTALRGQRRSTLTRRPPRSAAAPRTLLEPPRAARPALAVIVRADHRAALPVEDHHCRGAAPALPT